MKILVIDDDRAILDLISEYMKMCEIQCESASDGEAGLDLFLNTPEAFDVILLDVKMPGLDGMDLLRKLRKDGYQVSVILMTGHGDSNMASEARRLGVLDVLAKPFSPSLLRSLLSQLDGK